MTRRVAVSIAFTLLLTALGGCGDTPVAQDPVASPSPQDPVASPSPQDPVASPPLQDLETAAIEFNEGVGFSNRKDWDKAIAHYTEAIRLKPDYAEAYEKRADIYIQNLEYDKAITDYAKAVDLRPGLIVKNKLSASLRIRRNQTKAKAEVAKAEVAKAKDTTAGKIVIAPAKTISAGPVPIQAIRVLDKDSVLVVISHVVNIVEARDKKAPDDVRESSAQLRFEWSKWTLSTGQQLHRVTKESPFPAHVVTVNKGSEFPVHGTMISPDGSWIGVYGSSIDGKTNTTDSGVVTIWNTNSGREIATWKIKGASPYQVAVSPSGKRIALATAKGLLAEGEADSEDEFDSLESSVQIWNVREARREETLLTQRLLVSSLGFDQDGRHLCASITEIDEDDEFLNQSAIVWRTRDWTKTVRMEFAEEFFFPTAHLNESAVVVCDTGFLGPGTLASWDLRSGKKSRTFTNKETPERPVGFSPDGKRFAFKSKGTGTSLFGGLFFGSSKINEIAVIDIESGSIVSRLRNPKHDATAFSFTKDGRQIISGSSDGGIRIWKLPPSR